MPAITYTIEGESPLSLYTFSADLSALVINASSTFDMQPVKLGLIAHEPGEYTLSFAGLYSFGHEVTLMDADLNKSIVLGPSADEYKFTLIRPNGNKAIEVNDRFKLYFKYTGNGINFTPTEDAIASPLRVTSERGYINVSSSALPISALRVYDAHGRMVYQASNPAGAVKIPVAGGLYLVTARFGSEEKIKKIIVK